MADTLDDLERAVELLISRSEAYCQMPADCRYCAPATLRARELVRRLRAGIAECERLMSFDNTGLYSAAQLLHEKLTGATGEERPRGTT